MPAVPQRHAQQFDFYKYLRIIWRRKWLLVVPLTVCLPVAIAAAYFYKTEFESQAILEMQDNRPGDEALRVRGRAGDALSSVKFRVMSWNTIREIVLSRKVDFGREVDPDDQRQIEKLFHEITRRTRVARLAGMHIAISHRSVSPERNASLVNEIVKKFTDEDRRLAQDKAKNDVKYYRDKLASAKSQLAEIDGQMREFIQANPWLGENMAEIHRENKDAEEEEFRVRRQIAGVEGGLADLRKELAKMKPELVIKRPVEADPEVKAARMRYEAAKQYFERMNASYTPAHAKWREAKAVFDQAEAKLKEVGSGPEEREIEETKPNPEYADMQNRIAKQEKELERLNALKLEANKKVSETYVRVRKAPDLLAEKRGLEEQRSVAYTTVQDYQKGVRAAEKEMARLLTEAYSTRFRVIEYARPDMKPVKDTKMKIVALGLLLGLLTGAGLVGLIEYLDQTFKTIDDARDYLGLTALGVIPAIYTPRDHRRKLWFRVLAVSSAVFVVGVAVAIYLTMPPVQEKLKQGWLTFQDWMEYW